MGAYDEIRTARLVLRRWAPQDRQPFAALCADPVVMEHFPRILTRLEADAWVDAVEAHFDEHGYGLWAVTVDGRFAGFNGLRWADMLDRTELEIGWRMATWAWGQGYATEAARAALEVGLQVHSDVASWTAVTNERSWHVMERLGMRREAEFDHPRVTEGSPLRRHYLYRTA
jgi:RimJ/RimL family protein N-acetyltransferase